MTTAILAGVLLAVIVAVVLSALRTAKESGRDEERAHEAIKGIDHAKRANEIDEEVDGLSADELDRRMRERRLRASGHQ